jgi:ribosomal protein L7/L12
MNQFLSFFISIVCFLVLAGIYWLWVMKGFKSFLPKKKPAQRKPTMFDVRRLLQDGNRESAIKAYIEIFKVPLKKARKDIEELERNLKV